jgi:hypothetical protein
VIEEEGGKRCGSGFSPGGSITTAHGGNLPCHIGRSRPGAFFCTISKLIRELAYRLGKRLDDRKVHYPFPDTCLTTESGPSFTFETRHLGDSETIASRIPRLWRVKNAWFWAQQRGTGQTGRCCAFRPPRGSKCSSHGVSRPSALACPTPSMLSDSDRGVWQPQLIRPA